jgi:hypothetical protein
MSANLGRRASSLPSNDAPVTPSGSSRMSSTLYNPPSGQALSVPTSSVRAASNPISAARMPEPPNPARPRRQPAGGFLLDSGGSRKSSLEQPDKEREHGFYPSSSFKGKEQDHGPSDNSAMSMVNLVLSEAQKRKRESSAATGSNLPRNTLSVPPSSTAPSEYHRDRRGSGLRGRPGSPTRSFLIPGRSPSSSTTGQRRLGSIVTSSTSSPPPAPGRPNFPSPQLSSQLSTNIPPRKRRSLEEERLRELQKEYRFSDATLQRTLKAKQSLGLGFLYKKLLEIESSRTMNTGTLRSPVVDEKAHEYNPLRTIRNRKVRNRKKIQLDVSQWEDVGAVEQWVEDVGVSIHSPNGLGPGGLPPPPAGEGRKLKRAKMDWMIEPEEALADFYWARCEDAEAELKKKRDKRQSLKSLEITDIDLERKRVEAEAKRTKLDSPRTSRIDAGRFYPHAWKDDEGLSGSPPSSEDGMNSDSDYMFYDTDDGELESLEDPKHHRRRRKLSRMIGRHHEKKPLKYHELESSEHRWKQEAEETTSEMNDLPEYMQNVDLDEDYDPWTGQSKPSTELPHVFGGSRSSLDGVGLGEITDRADYVVPSIAISLSPPGTNLREQSQDMRHDHRKDHKVTPHKKSSNIKEKEFADDSGREEKGLNPLGRVKSRVDKLRNEVSKVEDLIPWRRESSIPSPTGSVFTGSEDEAEGISSHSRSRSRDTTHSASEREDQDVRTKGRQSLEVPDIRTPRATKHRTHNSMHSFSPERLFQSARRSIDSDRESSPERRLSKLRAPVSLERECSPIKEVKIESLRRKPEGHLLLDKLTTLQPPPILTYPELMHEDFSKQLQPNQPSNSSTRSKRELCHARATIISAGVLARGLIAKGPSTFAPVLREFDASSKRLDSTLRTYTSKQTGFSDEVCVQFHARIDSVNQAVTQDLTPLVQEVADDADRLSTLVTTELTLNVKRLQDEIFTIVRRRSRGYVKWLRRALFVGLEWIVVVLMWGVWTIFLGFRLARAIMKAVIRVVRWILWL